MGEEKKTVNVFLAAVHIKNTPLEDTQESMKELEALCVTLGFNVVGQEIQSRPSFESKTFLGKGKLEEIKAFMEEFGADTLVMDTELSPKQGINVEQSLDAMVLDRSQVILEIFSDHARTPESKAQVELARLYYMLPRLLGMWSHLDREKGGISASRGTGEKQISIDRNIVRKRMSKLQKDLGRIEKQRQNQSKQRDNVFSVSLVGYTNAGKTTLLKSLTGKGDGGKDVLFATLESTTRKLTGLTKPDILLSDTVGFIQKLPHHLIASFRSTLAVVHEADLLLHVVDASSVKIFLEIETTLAALKEIGADKVPRLLILNKADLIANDVELIILKKTFSNALFVSNLESKTIEELKVAIQEHFSKTFVTEKITLTYDMGGILSKLYPFCIVDKVDYVEEGMVVEYTATIPNDKTIKKMIKDMENK